MISPYNTAILTAHSVENSAQLFLAVHDPKKNQLKMFRVSTKALQPGQRRTNIQMTMRGKNISVTFHFTTAYMLCYAMQCLNAGLEPCDE